MTSSNLSQSTKSTGRSTMTGAKKAGVASLAGSVVFGMLAFSGMAPAVAAEPTVPLATAEGYSVLAGSTVTNTGPTVLNANLGVSPGTAVTGFPPGIIGGTLHSADGPALQAQSDLTTAYDNAAGRSLTATLPEQIAGTRLTGGVYESWNGKLALDGTITFDGENDPTSVFIMKSSSTLITGSGSKVAFINGAQACNVFWQVGSSATLGTDSTFAGSLMALTSVTANTGATIEGRLLARNGAVTLDTNVFTAPGCDMTIPTTTPSAVPSPTDSATNPVTPPTATATATATATTPVATPSATATSTAVIPSPSVSGTATTTAVPTATSTSTAIRTDTGTGTDTGTDTGTGTGTDTSITTETESESSATRLADTGVSSQTPLFASTGLMLLLTSLGLLLFGNRKVSRKH